MPVYKKAGGGWYEADRVHVRINGVYVPVNEVYAKDAGTWKPVHIYDVVPPSAPLLSLDVVETGAGGRYIKVGVRQPETGNVADVKLIRVMVNRDKQPPTPHGIGYYSTPADSNPNEPWSDFHFNQTAWSNRNVFGAPLPVQETNTWKYKRWPRNASNENNMSAGRVYFSVWAQDYTGNWSAGNFGSIVIPKKGVESANRLSKEARFTTTAVGTWKSGSFAYGRATQGIAPVRRGALFYGNAIRSNIGAQGPATIKSAQILLHRLDDGGRPRANVYLARHDFAAPSGFAESASWNEPTELGTIGKGESKWFNIPVEWYPELVDDKIRGFVLLQKHPTKPAQAHDFSVMASRGDNTRIGELHVVWTEKL